MHELLTQVVAWYAVAVAVFAGWHTLGRRPFSNALFYAIAALEAAVVAMFIGAVVALVRTDNDVATGLFISYFLVALIVAPMAVLWGIAEKSRWGTGVVIIGMWTVAILLVRLLQIWTAGA